MTKGMGNMKKILCVSLIVVMLFSISAVCCAADKENAMPDVFVNGNKVEFSDQNALIVENRTLVPVRGVFESMGCSVDWNADTYTVTVTTEDKEKSVSMVIGENEMKITGDPDKTSYTLDVPAQLINDRTMIPLRAVSEAFNCIVVWNDNTYSAYITSNAMKSDEDVNFSDIFSSILEESNRPNPELSLSTDAKDIKDGDVITVYVDIKNVPEGYSVAGILAAFAYDKEKIEYVEGSGTLLNGDKEEFKASLFDENLGYERGAKVGFGTIDKIEITKDEQSIFKADFKINKAENLLISIDANGGSGIAFITSDNKDVWYGDKNIKISDKNIINQ